MSYPSTTSSIQNALAGDLVLVVRFGALGVPPRFGDILALFPAVAAFPPFFFYKKMKSMQSTAEEESNAIYKTAVTIF